MMNLWNPEKVVEADLAKSLIEEQFEGLSPVSIVSLSKGWDNTVFLVNEAVIFRFPRRQIAVSLLETESKWLPVFSRELPLQTPVPIYFGKPSERYPWPFVGYQMVKGKTACTCHLNVAERQKAAPIIGNFLKVLHSLPLDEAMQKGLPGDDIGRLNIEMRLKRAKKDILRLKKLGLFCKTGNLISLLEESAKKAKNSKDVVVHGDFYVRHLIVNDEREITGVIDWGDMHIGDPACDLAILHSFFPKKAHQSFLRAYGSVNNGTWNLSRFRAICHTAVLALYAHDVVDQDLLKEAQLGLKMIVSNSHGDLNEAR